MLTDYNTEKSMQQMTGVTSVRRHGPASALPVGSDCRVLEPGTHRDKRTVVARGWGRGVGEPVFNGDPFSLNRLGSSGRPLSRAPICTSHSAPGLPGTTQAWLQSP